MLFRCELSALSRCEYLNEPEWRFSFYARLQKPSRCDLLPRVSRHERHEKYTPRSLRVLTLRALRFLCGRCVKYIKEKVSRHERCEKYTQRTLRVLTLRTLRFLCERCVKYMKKGFSPRTPREYHATNATSTYVANVAFSLRTLREIFLKPVHNKMYTIFQVFRIEVH